MRTAVFLDLNGTLAHPVHNPQERRLRPLPGAFEALALLRKAGLACAVVTVQARIDRGLFDEAEFRQWFAEFERAATAVGGSIDGLYLCPHDVGARCRCRKPATELYELAAADLGASLRSSWVVGDTSNDLRAAAGIGARAILVRTGYGSYAQSDPTPREAVVDDVLSAARLICEATCRDLEARGDESDCGRLAGA